MKVFAVNISGCEIAQDDARRLDPHVGREDCASFGGGICSIYLAKVLVLVGAVRIDTRLLVVLDGRCGQGRGKIRRVGRHASRRRRERGRECGRVGHVDDAQVRRLARRGRGRQGRRRRRQLGLDLSFEIARYDDGRGRKADVRVFLL